MVVLAGSTLETMFNEAPFALIVVLPSLAETITD